MSSFRLNNSTSLKSSLDIDNVFKNGKKLSSKLMTLTFAVSKKNRLRIAFSVGKKSHDLAVTRNKLKRLMREAFRLNAGRFIEKDLCYDFVFVYFGPNKVSFFDVEHSMKSLLLSFKTKVLS